MSQPGNRGIDLVGSRRQPSGQERGCVTRAKTGRLFLLLLAAAWSGISPAAAVGADDPEAPANALEPETGLRSNASREAPDNPLERLIRGIFKPGGLFGGPPSRAVREGGADLDEDGERVSSSDRDSIDARAPHDAKVEQQLRTAEAAIRQGDWKQGVPLLQKLLDLPEDSLHRLPDRRWQSVRVTASRLLRGAPREVLEDYRQQNGGLAQQLLNDALKDGDLPGVAQVATRFFQTPAGQRAADWLARLHQDHAEFGLAALWLENLLAAGAPLTDSPVWRLNALAVAQQAGRADLVRQLKTSLNAKVETVQAAGKSVALSDWLTSLKPLPFIPATTQDDWRMLYGTPDRCGIQSGSAPFLKPVWHIPYSSNQELCRQMEWLMQDLNDQNRPTMLMAQPLAVNGKLIYRDLRGMQVVDLLTGRKVWESIEGLSAERILTGTAGNSPSDGTEATTFDQESRDPFEGHQAEFHPLTSLLLRDAVYHALSSDGRQVFLLEDQGILSRQQPGFQWGWDGEEEAPYGFSWTTNRLSSYDVETGRLLWTVGGEETSESFQLPLAGVYFHGAPTPDGDDLLAIGSRGEEVRLWCLDRRTGGLNWSQLIAFSDSKIDQDIGRRWLAAMPSVAEGIVACPTGLGWLVAVDRRRRAVLWAVRSAPPGETGELSAGANLVPQQELGDHWGPSAPIISEQSVVFTPPEDDCFLCVDLITGQPRWRRDREAGQYLLGVSEGSALIVSQHHLAAYSVRDGKSLWTCPFSRGTQPSGRGVLTSERAFIPLNNGELMSAALDSGKAQRLAVPDDVAPLGNLVMHRGLVVSLGADGLTAFRQEAALWTEIQQRKTENAIDEAALLSEAEIHLANRRETEALRVLRQITPQQLSPELHSRLHDGLVQGLVEVIRQHPLQCETEIAELERLAGSPDEQLLHRDLSAERLLALNRHHEAFLLYWRLAGELAGEPMKRRDDSRIRVDRRAWLRGRLHDVWIAAGADERQQIDEHIQRAVQEAGAENESDRRRLADDIAFHPHVLPLRQRLIEDGWQAENFAATELELMLLAESANRPAAAWAVSKLAALMEERGLPDDAVAWYRRLETDFGQDRLPTGPTGAELVQDIRRQERLRFERQSTPVEWSDGPVRAVRSVVQTFGQPEQEVVLPSSMPFLASLDVELLPQEHRLRFQVRHARRYDWSAALRTSAHNQPSQFVSAAAVGHVVAVIHQDLLHLLSPVQKKVLWNRVLPNLGEGAMSWQVDVRSRDCGLWSLADDFESQWSLLQQSHLTGRLALAQAGYLAVHGRRTVEVFDPTTGREIWRRDHVIPQTKVVGGPATVWFIPPDASECQVYRAADGATLKIKEPAELLAKAVCFVGNDLLLAERGAGIKFLAIDRTQTVLRRYNPVDESTAWRREYGPKTVFALLDEEELLAVQPTGAVELIDIRTGELRSFDPLAAKELQGAVECSAVVDDERLFLVVNRHESGGYYNFGESLSSMPVHGAVFAWQKRTGKFLWKQSVARQNLILDHFRSSPLLLFCTREWKQKGNANFSLLHLLALQKQSGKVLHDSSVPTMHNGFHSVGISFTEPSVELKAHNLRIKLTPGQDGAAASPSGN